MATTTLEKPTRKAKPAATRTPVFEVEPSASFCMPTGSMTLDEFRQWTYSDDFPQTGLIAYLGKEIFVDMSPERLKSHGSVKSEVCTVVHSIVRRKKSGKFYSDSARITNVAAQVSNEPDGLFVSWKSLKSSKIRMVPTADGADYIELEGSADWILEIVSPSSVTKDKKTLRDRYHRAGIAEYWLIDARGDELDFQILVHGEDDFEPAKRVGAWQVSPVFGKKFRLRRFTDELGDDDYRLDVK
jgi:Uma2 family endonuclease